MPREPQHLNHPSPNKLIQKLQTKVSEQEKLYKGISFQSRKEVLKARARAKSQLHGGQIKKANADISAQSPLRQPEPAAAAPKVHAKSPHRFHECLHCKKAKQDHTGCGLTTLKKNANEILSKNKQSERKFTFNDQQFDSKLRTDQRQRYEKGQKKFINEFVND